MYEKGSIVEIPLPGFGSIKYKMKKSYIELSQPEKLMFLQAIDGNPIRSQFELVDRYNQVARKLGLPTSKCVTPFYACRGAFYGWLPSQRSNPRWGTYTGEHERKLMWLPPSRKMRGANLKLSEIGIRYVKYTLMEHTIPR